MAKVGSTTIPLQTDEISSHRDGSARFAVLSAQLANVQPGETRIINLYRGSKTSNTPNVPANPDWNLELEAKVYDGSGNVTGTFVAQPQAQLQNQIANGTGRRLSGPVASEYTVVAQFKNKATGAVHPHLTARLHTGLYDSGNRIRTDVVLENTRTFTSGPGNITYDLSIKRNGTVLHTQPKFTHNHHARWHKVLWTGGAQPTNRLRHHMPYFMASRITWNYDLSLKVPETVLAADAASLAKADTKPMGPAYIAPYFPSTGGRADIGPLPRWAALYLVTQDDRTRASLLANADAAGGIPVHYRDESTDQPLSIEKYPSVSVGYGSSTPTIPAATGSTIWDPDQSHQPSLAYIPYLITGDAFYQDEIMFWGSWNMAYGNPEYRNRGDGLVKWEQIRGQAWILRSISEAAHALPDNHAMKGLFRNVLAKNIDWFAANYVNNSSNSPLGAIEKPDEFGKTGPWQNDFVGIVFSRLAEAGEPKAKEVLDWFSKFNVGRLTNEANGFCAAQAPGYYWMIRDSSGKFITSWSALFSQNYSGMSSTSCSSLADGGYPDDAAGYAAYIRAMLGAAANAGVANAASAYAKWKTMTPKMDAAFTTDPTWAITPR
ncbi:hypothetical protein [Alicycliphilus denitrificans]|uniref:hypothetical protein n=1 Tax=Alicycliphilus denitrificans TaxID=179636 RepID=UPI00384ED6BA